MAGDWRVLIQASHFAGLRALDTDFVDKATRGWLNIATLYHNG